MFHLMIFTLTYKGPGSLLPSLESCWEDMLVEFVGEWVDERTEISIFVAVILFPEQELPK